MGFLSKLRWSAAALSEPAPTFSVEVDPVMLYGPGVSPVTPIPPAPRIDRKSALQVPAVKRCRDLIAGTLATLPVELFDPDNQRETWPLMAQPEPADSFRVPMSWDAVLTWVAAFLAIWAWSWIALIWDLLKP